MGLPHRQQGPSQRQARWTDFTHSHARYDESYGITVVHTNQLHVLSYIRMCFVGTGIMVPTEPERRKGHSRVRAHIHAYA